MINDLLSRSKRTLMNTPGLRKRAQGTNQLGRQSSSRLPPDLLGEEHGVASCWVASGQSWFSVDRRGVTGQGWQDGNSSAGDVVWGWWVLIDSPGNCRWRVLSEVMGSWLGHQRDSLEVCQQAAHRSVSELALGKPGGALMELAGVSSTVESPTHWPSTTGAGRTESSRNQKPIFPSESLQRPLLAKLNVVSAGKEVSLSQAEKWKGDLKLKGSKFLNVTAGNNCIGREKLVNEAQKWEGSFLFTVNLCAAWFGEGALRNFFNSL